MTDDERDDERDEIERARRDPSAFGPVFERHYDAIFGYVLRRIGDWSVAQEVTSEVFWKALSNLGRFRWQGVPFSAWLYRIAANEIAQVFRGAPRRASSLDALVDLGFDPVDPATREEERREAEARIDELATFARIRHAVAALRLRDQEVIALRYFERKSLREMATILGKKEGTVKSILSRALEKLRARLGSDRAPECRP